MAVSKLGRALGVEKLHSFFQRLPQTFEANNYDYRRFRLIFLSGTIATWVLILSIYGVFNEAHTFGGALVAILSAIVVTLILFPLAIAQSNKDYASALSIRKEDKE